MLTMRIISRASHDYKRPINKLFLVLVSVRQDQERNFIINIVLMPTAIFSLQELLIWVPGIKSNLARDIIKLSGVSEWKNMYKVRAYAFSDFL